jgi:hypothetical protein
MSTGDLEQPWRLGGQVTLGRRFCCDQWAVEGTYWTVSEFESSASRRNTNPTDPLQPYVSTPLTAGWVLFGGRAANEFFDHAEQHTIWRTDEVHNFEVNLIRNRVLGDSCSPVHLDWLVGVRYFRFREDLTFGSIAQGETTYSIFMNDDVENNLIGLQIGLNADYCICPRLKVFLSPKFGIYDNYMHNEFDVRLADGTHGLASQYNVQYPLTSSGNRVSFLTQVDVGLDWQFAQRWSAQVGYRVLAVTGVALADAQVPVNIGDTPAIADIDRNGCLILHGAFAGLTYCF